MKGLQRNPSPALNSYKIVTEFSNSVNALVISVASPEVRRRGCKVAVRMGCTERMGGMELARLGCTEVARLGCTPAVLRGCTLAARLGCTLAGRRDKVRLHRLPQCLDTKGVARSTGLDMAVDRQHLPGRERLQRVLAALA